MSLATLRDITRQAEEIRAFKFDGPAAGPSMVLEVDQLSAAIEMTRGTIRRFLDIAISLAAETNFTRLLDRVVRETSSATGAAAGMVYLTAEDGETLEPAALVQTAGEPLRHGDAGRARRCVLAYCRSATHRREHHFDDTPGGPGTGPRVRSRPLARPGHGRGRHPAPRPHAADASASSRCSPPVR